MRRILAWTLLLWTTTTVILHHDPVIDALRSRWTHGWAGSEMLNEGGRASKICHAKYVKE